MIDILGLKWSYNATCTFTSCLNWNACWQCVYTTPLKAFITVRVSSHPAPISRVKEFLPALLLMVRRQFCEEN